MVYREIKKKNVNYFYVNVLLNYYFKTENLKITLRSFHFTNINCTLCLLLLLILMFINIHLGT